MQFYSSLLARVSCYLVSTRRANFCISKSCVLVFSKNSVFGFYLVNSEGEGHSVITFALKG